MLRLTQEEPTSFHYPSFWEAKDGTLHLTYSYFVNSLPRDAPRKSIKHAHFDIDWIGNNLGSRMTMSASRRLSHSSGVSK